MFLFFNHLFSSYFLISYFYFFIFLFLFSKNKFKNIESFLPRSISLFPPLSPNDNSCAHSSPLSIQPSSLVSCCDFSPLADAGDCWHASSRWKWLPLPSLLLNLTCVAVLSLFVSLVYFFLAAGWRWLCVESGCRAVADQCEPSWRCIWCRLVGGAISSL